MNPQYILYINVVILFSLVLVLNWKFNLLKDSSIAAIRPYSQAKVQMAWWSLIILASYFTIMFTHRAIPNLDKSAIILYSIGMAAGFASGMVDASHDDNPNILNDKISRNQNSQGFWVDILSDNNGITMPRLLNVLCNFGIGCYFLFMVWYNLPLPSSVTFTIDNIMPVINDTSLVMMGVTNTAYVGFKTSENKPEAK